MACGPQLRVRVMLVELPRMKVPIYGAWESLEWQIWQYDSVVRNQHIIHSRLRISSMRRVIIGVTERETKVLMDLADGEAASESSHSNISFRSHRYHNPSFICNFLNRRAPLACVAVALIRLQNPHYDIVAVEIVPID